MVRVDLCTSADCFPKGALGRIVSNLAIICTGPDCSAEPQGNRKLVGVADRSFLTARSAIIVPNPPSARLLGPSVGGVLTVALMILRHRWRSHDHAPNGRRLGTILPQSSRGHTIID